jgi:hypothetical protein
MVNRNSRTARAAIPDASRRAQGPTRLAIGRVRLRSLARVGFSVGWIVSLVPSLLTSAFCAWVLHGIWTTLDGWTPWSPWSPDTRILGVPLPTPEFAPREALRLEGFYQRLEPIGQHPFIGALLSTLALTVIGGLIFTLILTLAGLAYNLFAGVTGGIEFELNERPTRRALPRGSARPAAGRDRDGDSDDWDEAELRW